jgi:hypothetical protein
VSLHALVLFAQEVAHHGEEESSKTAFYVAGGLLAAFGFLIGILGTMRHNDFPGEGAAKGLMAVAAVLVLGTMAAAVATG